MLEISQAVEYGLRGITRMALMGGERPALVKEIAEAEDISTPFLHKIFQRMVRHRILSSKRGVGYTFGRPAEEVTLLDVIHAIEGPIMMRRCVLDENYCERGDQCTLASYWTEIQDELVAKLGSITIRDLAGPKASP